MIFLLVHPPRLLSSPSTNDSAESSPDAWTVVKALVFILLSGVGVALVLKLISYLAAAVADRCVRGTGDPGPADDIDRGTLTHNANLRGLRLEERELILQHLLQKTTFTYSAKAVQKFQAEKDDDDHNEDVEMGVVAAGKCSNAKRSAGVSMTEVDVVADTVEGTANTATVNTIPHDLNNTDHHTMCCICLVPYEEGVAVMMGTLCHHMFHRSCCQNWLLEHDDCPYCRKDMLLATELREAAVAVLGEERVAELSLTPTTTPDDPENNAIPPVRPLQPENATPQGQTIGDIVISVDDEAAFVQDNETQGDATSTCSIDPTSVPDASNAHLTLFGDTPPSVTEPLSTV
jgi:Ring finger domain